MRAVAAAAVADGGDDILGVGPAAKASASGVLEIQPQLM